MESKTRPKKYLPAGVAKAALMQELSLNATSKPDKDAYKCIQICVFDTLELNLERNLMDVFGTFKAKGDGWVAAKVGSAHEKPVGAEVDEDLDENIDADPGEGRSHHPGEGQLRLPYDPIRDVLSKLGSGATAGYYIRTERDAFR